MPGILVIACFPTDEAALMAQREQLAAANLSLDIQLTWRGVKAGPDAVTSAPDEMLLDLAVFEAGLDAEAKGFDAVCIDAFNEGGTAALRSVLGIPVVAPGKATMLHALTLGARFAILAQGRHAVLRHRKAVDAYGLAAQCASVRAVEPDAAFATALEEARRCVEDGAQVILLGATTMHQVAAHLAEVLDVPVIDPFPLCLQQAETFLTLGLRHSQRAYPDPVVPRTNVLRALLQGGAAFEAGW